MGTGVQSRNSMTTPGGNACDSGTTSLVTIHGLAGSALSVGTTPWTAGQMLTGVNGQGRTLSGRQPGEGCGALMVTGWKGQTKLGFGVACVGVCIGVCTGVCAGMGRRTGSSGQA